MRRLGPALARAADWLAPEREAILEDWVRAVSEARAIPEGEALERCTGALDRLLGQLSEGDVDGLLVEEAGRPISRSGTGTAWSAARWRSASSTAASRRP
jgi:hypothetical protein